jgi:LPXTG-motif cell wall-anchored protein
MIVKLVHHSLMATIPTGCTRGVMTILTLMLAVLAPRAQATTPTFTTARQISLSPWAFTRAGQLDDGTTTDHRAPVPTTGLTSVTAIAAGRFHSLALKQDGTVWAWGSNVAGELGDGTATDRQTPVQVQGLSGVTAIAAGAAHSLALKRDGTVWAWGAAVGTLQPPDLPLTPHPTPVQVRGLSGVTAIAAGGSHDLALKGGGTVWAWGSGWLGDGTTADSVTPVQVRGLSSVTAIAAGGPHSLALKQDGTVWAWGANGNAALGDGTFTDRPTPVPVRGLSGVMAIAAGSHSLTLKRDGRVWAWGANGALYVQLGPGTLTDRPTPALLSGLMDVTAIAAGGLHSLALKRDGTVWAWAFNIEGQLGDGTLAPRETPVPVRGLSGVTAIAAGGNHSLALKRDGSVWAWGANRAGELGDGTLTDRLTPVPTSGRIGVTADRVLTATLSGGPHELPAPGDPDGQGTAWITLKPARFEICWQLQVRDIMLPATWAHLHAGGPHEAGGVVLGLIPPDATGTRQGCDHADGGLLQQLAQNPAAFYVDVHTTEFPAGAIRGQLTVSGGGGIPISLPATGRSWDQVWVLVGLVLLALLGGLGLRWTGRRRLSRS